MWWKKFVVKTLGLGYFLADISMTVNLTSIKVMGLMGLVACSFKTH